MDILSNSLLLELVRYIPLNEVFNTIQLLDKRFHNLIRDESSLSVLIARELHISRTVHFNLEDCQRIIQEILRKSSSRFIKFRGFVTDGGVDEDHPSFWVNNMFKKNKNPYCTREQKVNVNVAAVLRCTQSSESLIEKAKNEISEVIKRWLKSEGNADEFKSSKVFKGFRHYYNLFNQDLLAAEDEEPEEFKRRLRENMELLSENVNPISLRRYPDDPYILESTIDYISANNSTSLACIHELKISRSGDLTCPVGSLVVFISDKYLDITSEEFILFNNLKTLPEVVTLCTHHHIDYISYENSEERYKCVEFYPGKSNLKPILWVGFDDNKTFPFHTFQLKNWYTGVYLYVKLIYPHNRMREQNWMHEDMNIDCSYVKAKGSVIDLTGK